MTPIPGAWSVSEEWSRGSCPLPAGIAPGHVLTGIILSELPDIAIDGWDVDDWVRELPTGWDDETGDPIGSQGVATLVIRRVDGSESDPVEPVSAGAIYGIALLGVSEVDAATMRDGGGTVREAWEVGIITAAIWGPYTEFDDSLCLLVGAVHGGQGYSTDFSPPGTTSHVRANVDNGSVLAINSFPVPTAGEITVTAIRNEAADVTGLWFWQFTLRAALPPVPPSRIGGLLRTTGAAPITLARSRPAAPILVSRTKGEL